VESQPDADFFRVSVWDALGENCAKYLSKGKKVAVVGAVSVHAYKTQNGEPGASLEVIAQEVEFLSPRSDSVDQQSGITKANPADNPFVNQEDIPY
jgi:single-strand DNA-binding protein